jgi:riboflavin synthase
MFTGIIEALGEVKEINKEKGNLDIVIKSPLSNQLKIGQSISHNGICLTVVNFSNSSHQVTAVNETLKISTLNNLMVGDLINLERSLKVDSRLDGHFVQGHIDQIGRCEKVVKNNGSWIFSFEHESSKNNITVEKGSICVDGVSLTVINSEKGGFSVSIIPYTFENTRFRKTLKGSKVNLEFDVLGKYISKLNQI